eukprot:TRINITY_DN16082_c0_g1_i1.p1 TRINITY_DN16082_c0_g1~~TRINITY_DN16082_c0_g1_i1.p1  ORF type:complete len:279 (+),score=31.19 TRINITY_DN16082_c0_g1_i1:58-894(+)
MLNRRTRMKGGSISWVVGTIAISGVVLFTWLWRGRTKKITGGDEETLSAVYVDPELRDMTKPVVGAIVAINCPPTPENPFKLQLDRISEEISAIEAGVVHMYAMDAIHTTVATTLNFKFDHPNVAPEAYSMYIEHWKEDLEKTLKSEAVFGGLLPFKMTIHAPKISKAAAYFPIENPTGEVEQLRRAIKKTIAKNDRLNFIQGQHIGKEFHVPGIIHSTLLRFKKSPTDVPAWMKTFHQISATWEPVTVTVDKVYVAVEDRPYMHIPHDPEHFVEVTF